MTQWKRVVISLGVTIAVILAIILIPSGHHLDYGFATDGWGYGMPPQSPSPTGSPTPGATPTVTPTATPTTELTGEGTVPPEGGTVTTTDGRVTLQFAEGAFAADAEVMIEPITCGAAPEGFRMGATCFYIQAIVDGESVSELGADVTICVEYSDADLATADSDPNLLSLAYYDATAGEWVVLVSTVVDGTICATTNHLSNWAVVAEAVEAIGLQWWHILLIALGGLAIIAVMIWLAAIRPRPRPAKF